MATWTEAGFAGKVAVCDVGYGTIQNALQEIFSDVDITGFYIGKKEEKLRSTLIQWLFYLMTTKIIRYRQKL